jgi:DNA-binding NarL/FixJ family response regulator
MATIGSTHLSSIVSSSAKDTGVVTRLSSGASISGETEPSKFTTLIVPTAKPTTIVIEPRTLIRDCLARCLKGLKSDEIVCAVASVADWLQDGDVAPSASLVLLCTGERRSADVEHDIVALSRFYPSVLIVLLSDGEDVSKILGALDKGARGYIPTSMSLEVVVEAMQLVRAGGIFVPASSLLSSRKALADPLGAKGGRNGLFTARQAAVVEALRQGKSNKIIAYELNMRESTVKVHVRNIMKKLNARNRTEVAFRVNGMAANGEGV